MKPKITGKTTIAELAAIVCEALKQAGIDAFLSGGAVVSIYTENKYESYDLDFVTHADRRRIKDVMTTLGFTQEESRLFTHSQTKYMEFPGAALAVGSQPIRKFSEIILPQGKLRLLTPTDCVKDRLAAYYHWNDRQGLNQAVLVARSHKVDLKEIETWSTNERMKSRFQDFLDALKSS